MKNLDIQDVRKAVGQREGVKMLKPKSMCEWPHESQVLHLAILSPFDMFGVADDTVFLAFSMRLASIVPCPWR